MAMLKPTGDAIMDHLGATGESVVLGGAAGTGEPGLSNAKHLHGGKVIITDIAGKMLDVAREKAAAEGITNVEFREADAHDLPFDDNTFDEVSCRMGFMFFPDERQGRAFQLAIPTPEHYLPLLYTLALQDKGEEPTLFNDQPLAGSLTMTSVMIR